MASGRADVSRQLQTLFSLGTAGALTDGELLERFASRRGAAAEAAFAALVERHGPVVLRVCRDVLGNSADAEDAFQATFLVLVRRAGTIRNRDSLASWLYGVALRVAACARSATVRRRVHEGKAIARTTEHVEEDGDDLGPVLHEEVGRLPEKYRAAVVLCYWEGLTHEQAADRLRWPVGTVRSRLSWARQRLRSRLIRRGLAPAAVEVTTSAEAVPEALLDRTVQGGLQFVAGLVHGGVVSTSVGMLTEGVIRTMMLARWKLTAFVLLTVGVAAAGAWGFGQQDSDRPRRSEVAKGDPPLIASPSGESDSDKQIRILNDYSEELSQKIKVAVQSWLEMSEKSSGGLFVIDEYKRVADELFKVKVEVIENEAELEHLRVESEAERAKPRPLTKLDGAREAKIRELRPRIDVMQLKKKRLELLLAEIDFRHREHARDALKAQLIRENLDRLRAAEESVRKRIEQLEIDARAARPRERQ